MTKRKALVITIVILIIGAIYFVFSTKRSNITTVKSALVTRGEVRSYLSTTGVIKSKQSKEYYGAQLRINKINVKVGDKVNKGDKMLSYEIEDLKATTKQAQIQYDNAILQKRDLENQRKEVQKNISRVDEKIKEIEGRQNPIEMSMIEELKEQRKMFQPISEEKIKQVDNAINIAKVNLDSAKSKINNVDKGIIADFDGVITTINVSEGGVGNPGQPAIILENINNLKLVVSLGRYDAEKVKLNQEATIKGIDKSYKGRVSFISPAAKGSASAPSIGGINGGGDTTLNIDIDILDKSQDLKINFDADVDLLIGSANNILKIPVEAIINDKDDKNYVFINENGVAKQKEIRIGLQSDTEVQVLQGLKEGEKVILNPGNIIKSGMKIKESVEEENVRG